MNTRDTLRLIFWHISDSRIWCRLSQTCHMARQLGKKLLVHKRLPFTNKLHGPQEQFIIHKRGKPKLKQQWYYNGKLIQEYYYYIKSEKVKMTIHYNPPGSLTSQTRFYSF